MHLKRRKIDLFNLIKRRELWRQQINSFPSTHTLSINCPKKRRITWTASIDNNSDCENTNVSQQPTYSGEKIKK